MTSVRAVVARRVPAPVRRTGRQAVVRYRHTGITAADLVFVSFPKSGNTWVRFVLAQALFGESADFDTIRRNWPPLELRRSGPPVLSDSGRLLKSHELPRFVGRSRPKVLALIRDGRDVAISYHRQLQRRGVSVPPLDEFVLQVADGRADVYGSWPDHTRAWRRYVENATTPAVLVRYEDLLTDPLPALLSIARTLDLPVTEVSLQAALAANTPTEMRSREASSRFLASVKATNASFVGTASAGGWQQTLRPDTVARFEAIAGAELVACGYSLHDAG